jgi:hypothetical protein
MPYGLATADKDPDTFLTKALDFTMKWPRKVIIYWKKILPDSAPSLNLKIIDRVQTNIDIFSKIFSYNQCITFRCFSIPSILNLWCDSKRIFKKN